MLIMSLTLILTGLHFQISHTFIPHKDFDSYQHSFVTKLGLKRMQFTTQIEHYDNLGALLDNIKRINTILLDLAKDMWAYPPTGKELNGR